MIGQGLVRSRAFEGCQLADVFVRASKQDARSGVNRDARCRYVVEIGQ